MILVCQGWCCARAGAVACRFSPVLSVYEIVGYASEFHRRRRPGAGVPAAAGRPGVAAARAPGLGAAGAGRAAGHGAVCGVVPGRRAGPPGVSPAADGGAGDVLLLQGGPVVAGGGDGHLGRCGRAGDLRGPAPRSLHGAPVRVPARGRGEGAAGGVAGGVRAAGTGQRGRGRRGRDEGEGQRVDGRERDRGAAGGRDRRAGGAAGGRGGGLVHPGPGRGPGTLARLADKIVRLRKAGARLEKQEQARQEQAAAGQQERLARARQRMARAEERAAREEAAAAARVRDYQRRAAAKAAAGGRGRPDGRVPVAAGGSAHVRRARQAADRARQVLAETAAAPPDPGPGGQDDAPKANTTDPASRVMPARHGGFPQGYNVQVLGGRHQVIYAIATHDNPADTAALHPLLAQARGNLDAAGIRDPIGTALFDAGYASDANFTAACQAELYVAVTKEARQTGRLRDGKTPASALPSWQAMAARLDTPDGKALYRRRPAIIEPVFAQLFNRLGRDLHYRDTKTDLELHLRAASHNFLKAIRRNQRRTPPAPGLAPAS